MPEILTTHPLVEDALAPFVSALGAARAAYTGHVYRVLNVARAFEPSPSAAAWFVRHPLRPLPMLRLG